MKICHCIVIHSFIHSFLQCLLSTYYLPGSVLGTGDIVINKGEKTAVLTALILCWKRKAQTSQKQNRNKKPDGDKFLKKINTNDRQGCVTSYWRWEKEEGLYILTSDEVTLADLNLQVHKIICHLPFLFRVWIFKSVFSQTVQLPFRGNVILDHGFNLYAEYIIRNTGLDETLAGIKIARRNISNLRYADDTIIMAGNEEELKNLLMKVKEETEKSGWKPNIHKTNIMASGPITSWQVDGETMETAILYFLGLQNHCRWLLPPWNLKSDACSLEEKLWPTCC